MYTSNLVNINVYAGGTVEEDVGEGQVWQDGDGGGMTLQTPTDLQSFGAFY